MHKVLVFVNKLSECTELKAKWLIPSYCFEILYHMSLLVSSKPTKVQVQSKYDTKGAGKDEPAQYLAGQISIYLRV